MVILSISCAGLYSIVYPQVKIAGRFSQWAIGQHLARSACLYFAAQRNSSKTEYDDLAALRKEITLELGPGEFTYIALDQESKVNLKNSDKQIISRLIESVCLLSKTDADEIADNIITYRSGNPFVYNNELLAIPGVDEEIYDKLESVATLLGEGNININTAPFSVLQAVGLNKSVAESIIYFRNGRDDKEGTADDGVFETVGEIVDKLYTVRMLSTEDEININFFINSGKFIVKSKNFILEVKTEVKGKEGNVYYIVLDQGYVIKDWREEAAAVSSLKI